MKNWIKEGRKVNKKLKKLPVLLITAVLVINTAVLPAKAIEYSQNSEKVGFTGFAKTRNADTTNCCNKEDIRISENVDTSEMKAALSGNIRDESLPEDISVIDLTEAAAIEGDRTGVEAGETTVEADGTGLEVERTTVEADGTAGTIVDMTEETESSPEQESNSNDASDMAWEAVGESAAEEVMKDNKADEEMNENAADEETGNNRSIGFAETENTDTTLKTNQAIEGNKQMGFLEKRIEDIEGNYINIRLIDRSGAGIPEGAQLAVKEICREERAFQGYLKAAQTKLDSEIPYAKFLDITLLDENGEEIQPDEEVDVELTLSDLPQKAEEMTMRVIHFEDGPGGLKDPDLISDVSLETARATQDGRADAGTITFTADGFSVYGITAAYTVDFYYGDAMYQMDGGSEISLSELFDHLGIDRLAEDAEEVRFSDENLIRILRTENEWEIVSLNPFSTSETLTVQFDNGDVIVIGVEDAVGPFNCGTCQWTIDDDGVLTIAPVNGKSGTLNALGTGTRDDWLKYADSINEVKIVSEVKASMFSGGLGWMFANCTNLKKADLSGLNTSTARTMRAMFYNCPSLTEIEGLGSYSTANVTNMTGMFNGCSALKSIRFGDLWNTKKVTSMDNMFRNCASLVSLDLSRFDTEKVTTMASMFEECSSIEVFDLSGFNTPNLTNIQRMFFHSGTAKAKKLYLNQFDLRNVNVYAHFLQQMDHVEEVIIGSNFVYGDHIHDGFLRGLWIVDEDNDGFIEESESENWTSEQIAKRLMNDDGKGGYQEYEGSGFGKMMHFIRSSEHALQVDYPVTYYIGHCDGFELISDSEKYGMRGSELILTFDPAQIDEVYIDQTSLDGRTVFTINDSASLLFRNVVQDANGEIYNLRFTINNVQIIRKEEDQSIYRGSIFATDGGEYIFRQRNCEAVSVDITVRIETPDGEAVEGSYLFSGYDLDMTYNPDNYSEGFTFINGYSPETLTVSDYNFLNIGGGLNIGGDLYIRGTQPDSGTELSEFIIKADASGMRFIWSGTLSANTFILGRYQPGKIQIAKLDPAGDYVTGAGLAVYQRMKRDGVTSLISAEHPKGELIVEWQSSEDVRTLFLPPGSYGLYEEAVPNGYQIANPIYFRVDDDYNVWLADETGEEKLAPVSLEISEEPSGKAEGSASDGEAGNAADNAADDASGMVTIPPIRMIDEPAVLPEYVMPDTGGIGTSPFWIAGLALLALDFLLIRHSIRKRHQGRRLF